MPATIAPAARSSLAICRPMPPPAPVTTAVLPANPSRQIIASGPLEAPDQLVVGHSPVVLELLPAAGVQVMVDHRVAKCRAQHLRAVDAVERLAQRLRHLADLPRLVGVAGKRGLQLELLLDAVQAGGEER